MCALCCAPEKDIFKRECVRASVSVSWQLIETTFGNENKNKLNEINDF